MDNIFKVVRQLNKKGFIAKSFETMDQAKQEILSLIKQDESVGTGGSVTLGDCGVLQDLRDQGCEVISYMLDTPKDANDRARMRRESFNTDWFMSSSNAITQKGCLVNIDGTGNRVANLTYGTSKLIILAGKNKIVSDFDSAISRIKTEACGKNARRLGLSSPCGADDKCHDCSGSSRMCNVTSIIEYPTGARETHVIIVNEDWGY